MKKGFEFENVYISQASAIVGKKESEGPLGKRFDASEKDEYFGCKNFEEAESEMVRRNINLLLAKAQKSPDEIEMLFGGDLINQCIATSYGIKDLKMPYVGLYGACSTIIEALICSSCFIECGFINNAISVASSHFCSAERQYRFPLEYGSTRTPTSQNKVTGCGAFLLTNDKTNLRIKNATIGRIVDKGITDANNMGAAMACAAVDTIERFFENSNLKTDDFDYIITGDLGFEGHSIAIDMFNMDNFEMNTKFIDCGTLIYDTNKQDTHSGGSGCGCIASVLSGHFIKKFFEGNIRNILAIGTGALLNPDSVFQKKSIPSVAHAVHLTWEEL